MQNRSPLIWASIVLFFAMLWLPLGQYEFLIAHWMKIGMYGIPFLLIGAFTFYQGANKRLGQEFAGFAMAMLIAYILHQYEEHWVDLYGNYYSFYIFNNNFILQALGEPDAKIRPLSKESIFMINTSLVWLVGVLAIAQSRVQVFPLIAMASIIVVNGLVHILAGMVKWTYNPGLLTSLVIFLPLYFYFVNHLRYLSRDYKKLVLAGLIWAFLAHVIMVAGLLAANWFHLFPEIIYFVILVIWSLIPLALYRNKL